MDKREADNWAHFRGADDFDEPRHLKSVPEPLPETMQVDMQEFVGRFKLLVQNEISKMLNEFAADFKGQWLSDVAVQEYADKYMKRLTETVEAL